MKVLWITKSPFPEVYEELKMDAPVNVGWVHSAAKTLCEKYGDIDLTVASFIVGSGFQQIKKKGVPHHYIIPGEYQENIKFSENKIDRFWRQIKEEVKPDVIHMHGTEFPHSYSFVRACGAENLVVSIQGLVSVYERYYFGNIPRKDLLKTITFRDIARMDTIFSWHKNMRKRGAFERALLKKVNHIIGRTSWDKAHAWALNPDGTYHFCNETLRPAFYKNKWSIENCEKYSIFVSQGHYPIKGLHQLLKALPIVLKHYPKTRVYISGTNFFTNVGFRLIGFGKYINSLIKKNNLSDHIIFTGTLAEEEMCKRFVNSHVSVCPSAIENSPNSVGEAQLLGVPCVASYVGGVADMIAHEETGLLYRFEEIEMLADNICRLFSDKELAMHISEKSKVVAANRHQKDQNASRLYQIYSEIFDLKNN
ncbi:glycosyltransferase [Maribellus comscasis]|uniref:Glycosyltransferase n=1 Tax=Maribellus comscasis TaxID=2681766 RepID=A0A6I6JUU1_9BACT|nr:glycosyltransferase family 4 protein [Maribellus comscasis]QGY43922.1 glycosyltransferase [Maribellus comscasis]